MFLGLTGLCLQIELFKLMNAILNVETQERIWKHSVILYFVRKKKQGTINYQNILLWYLQYMPWVSGIYLASTDIVNEKEDDGDFKPDEELASQDTNSSNEIHVAGKLINGKKMHVFWEWTWIIYSLPLVLHSSNNKYQKRMWASWFLSSIYV